MHRCLPLLIVISLGLLWSCSTGSQDLSLTQGRADLPAAEPAPLNSAPAAGLPALPEGRVPTALTETSRDGAQSFARSSSALPADPVLQLNSTADELSWGIWELPATDELRYLDVQLALPAGQEAWLALADYQSQRWELFGPVVSGRILDLDPARHSSPGGNLYAAVIAFDGTAATVQSLKLIAFHSNAAPSAALQSDVSSGTAPLSVSFDASASSDPDNNISRYLWDFDGDGVFDGSSTVPQVSHVYSAGGSFNASVTAEDTDGEQDASAALSISVNSPPTAVLELPAAEVQQNETISLQGGNSFDSDGSIVKYEWDSDGNGSFETNSGSSKSIGLSAVRAGRLTLKLRVTDDDGAVDVALAQLYVRGFNENVATEQQFSGTHTQVLSVNGRPAVCFEAGADSTLQYCRALDSEGNTWPAPIELDPSVNSGEYNSMTMINGNPAISYRDQALGAMKYIRASDLNGAAWPAPEILEQGQLNETTGAYSSLAVVNGRPAVAYHNHFGENHYMRALDVNGDSWPAGYEVLDNGPGDTGYSNSLAVMNGFPAVAYVDYGNGNLMFIRAADANGDTWSTEKILDSSNETFSPSMTVIDGKPAIAYYRSNGGDLMYINCISPSGEGAWNSPVPLDTNGQAGKYPNLRVIGGLPCIAYNESTMGQVLLLRAASLDASLWDSPQVISPAGLPGYSGSYLCLAEHNGSPIFSYTELKDGNVGYVACTVGY